MQNLLRRGERFDEIIVIPSTDSQSLKATIASTVQRFQHDDIDDLLFYFTGHGEFVEEDFNYLLRDFDESRSAQTSLSNSELDNMLKSLEPGVLIKVVDACYSGMPYIKDGSDFSEYINNSSKGLFPKCYFMFSSESDQKSYASEDGSDFTKAFARAVVECQSTVIRYKDVIDFLSDSFNGHRRQKPLFVTQASFTEIFGSYSSESKKQISELTEKMDIEKKPIGESDNKVESEIATPSVSSLISLVQSDAMNYVSREAGFDFIGRLKSLLDLSPLDSEVGDLYGIKKEFVNKYSFLPNQRLLGGWLSENLAGEYFASPDYEMESYEVDSSWSSFMGLTGQEPRKITKTRRVISGIETNVSDLPFIGFSLILEPRYPNLLQYGGWLTYVISKTTIQVFSCMVEYQETSWGEYKDSATTKWNRAEFQLIDSGAVSAIVKNFYVELSSWATERIQNRLNKFKPD